MRFEAIAPRGGVIVWRQGSGDPPSPSTGTMAPRAKWQMRARGTRTFVWRTPSAASVDIIIPGVVGNAVAAGVTGAVTQGISIAGIVGNAVAAGVTGSASVSGSGTGATAAEIVAALMAEEIETGVSVRMALRIILAAVSGPTAGIGSSTERYYSSDGLVARITATFDGDSNRTSVTLDDS